MLVIQHRLEDPKFAVSFGLHIELEASLGYTVRLNTAQPIKSNNINKINGVTKALQILKVLSVVSL